MTQKYTVGKIEFLSQEKPDDVVNNRGLRWVEESNPCTLTLRTHDIPKVIWLSDHIQITEHGFVYKGELVEDAGLCYKKMMEFLSACNVDNMETLEWTRWYLQRDPYGSEFWDAYVHPECTLIMSEEFRITPFTSPKS